MSAKDEMAAKPDQGPSSRIAKAAGLISAFCLTAVICFTLGVLMTVRKDPIVEQGLRAMFAMRDFERAGIFAPQFLIVDTPSNAAPGRLFIPDRAEIPTGWRAIMAFDAGTRSYDVTLYDNDGEAIHKWNIFDRSGFDFVSTGKLGAPHGLIVGRDGAIFINRGVTGLAAKFDRCGREIWRYNDARHHEMNLDDDGFVWSWRGDGSNMSKTQWIVRFDPESGKIIESISLNDEILGSVEDQRAILGMPFAPDGGSDADMFHPNDVEILSQEMAPHFPMFQAGDILISLRNINTISVIDRKSHKIKWFARGPWRRQHDPDFMETGEISVFNNNFPTYGPSIVDRQASSIMAINPANGEVREILGPDKLLFYSHEMGAHSWISDHVLEIVSPFEGRVIEFDLSAGKKIFSFNNRIRDGVSAHVAMAEWLPPDYFYEDPRFFDCSER